MHGQPRVSAGYTRSYADPDQYHAAIRGGDALYSVLGRGTFHAELTSIEVGRVTLQRGREILPRLGSSAMPTNRVGILGWFGDGQLPVVRGVQIRQGELMCVGLGMQSHHRTFGGNDFVVLSLDITDLARAAADLTGRELIVKAGSVIRPPEHLAGWMMSVIEAATRAAATTPRIFTSPLAADAVEQALLRPMIMCLMDGDVSAETIPRRRRAEIARRFQATAEAEFDAPLLMSDVCRILGVPDRTLRSVCEEQLALSPQRFLALRRLHMTREALLRSDHRCTTVTRIATSHGFWELGRFAVFYKSLFGESPSVTLRRPVGA